MEAGTALARKRSSGWRFIACLILLTFGLQSYITQTHIHSATSAAVVTLFHHAPGKAPLDDNPVDCPFCQAVSHDGALHLPTVPLLVLFITFVELATPILRLQRPSHTLAHIWQSRAPPRH